MVRHDLCFLLSSLTTIQAARRDGQSRRAPPIQPALQHSHSRLLPQLQGRQLRKLPRATAEAPPSISTHRLLPSSPRSFLPHSSKTPHQKSHRAPKPPPHNPQHLRRLRRRRRPNPNLRALRLDLGSRKNRPSNSRPGNGVRPSQILRTARLARRTRPQRPRRSNQTPSAPPLLQLDYDTHKQLPPTDPQLRPQQRPRPHRQLFRPQRRSDTHIRPQQQPRHRHILALSARQPRREFRRLEHKLERCVWRCVLERYGCGCKEQITQD